MRNKFSFNVTCFMVLVCIVLGNDVSAAYSPNMGNQGITVHNNHQLPQADNVFNVPFAENNVNNNPLISSRPLSFHNEQYSIVWEHSSARFNPSPCFTQLTTISLHSLGISHNRFIQNNLNNNQPNSGLLNDQSSIISNNPSTCLNLSPCFTQLTTRPLYGSLANNYNNPPIQNNLSSYQDLNILHTFRSQEQLSIELQEKSILDAPYVSMLTDLTTTAHNQATREVEVNELLPMIDAFTQRKKRKVTPATLDKCASVPLTPKNNIDLSKCSQSVTPQAVHNTKKNKPTCYLCSKRFSQNSSLTRHLKSVHFKEKPYKCPYCQTRFAQNANLKRHVRTHTGEKFYPCFLCNKSFTRSDGLKRHIENTHLNKKRHPCPRCKSKFAEADGLKRHIRSVHNQEKPFKCDLCNKQYKQKQSLNDHMKKKHSEFS